MCKSDIKNTPTITVFETLSSSSYKSSLGCYTYHSKSRVRMPGHRPPLCCVLCNLGTVTTENLWRLNISPHPVQSFRNYSARNQHLQKILPSNDSDFGNTAQTLNDVFTVMGQKGNSAAKILISLCKQVLFVTNDVLGKSLMGKKGGCAKGCSIIQA